MKKKNKNVRKRTGHNEWDKIPKKNRSQWVPMGKMTQKEPVPMGPKEQKGESSEKETSINRRK